MWNPQSLPGREGMMYARYIAAQAFNCGGLGIIHSISHAVSAFYDTHHGLNNAIALPRVWAFNMPVAYSYSKNRLGAFYGNSPTITGDAADVDRVTNHVLGDARTQGNARECTFETVRPVVEHCMTGDLDDLLS